MRHKRDTCLQTKSPQLPSVASGTGARRVRRIVSPRGTRTTSAGVRHKRTQGRSMKKDTKFKLGQSGNPQSTFKAGNKLPLATRTIRESGWHRTEPVAIRGMFLCVFD